VEKQPLSQTACLAGSKAGWNDIFYWTSGNQAEIEFMFQCREMIIPVEAKSALSTKAKSLSEYRKKYLPELSVRFSLKNVEKNGDLLNLPLFLADYTEKLIKFGQK
jgi:hypothetical protein